MGLVEYRGNTSARAISAVLSWQAESALWMSPPYQRGDVWGKRRRQNLIRSLLEDVPISTIVINDRLQSRGFDGSDFRLVVVDGRQRLTAMLMFYNNELALPGSWFDVSAEEVRLNELPDKFRLRFKSATFSVSMTALPTEELERALFDRINFGGLAQGEQDLD